MTHLLAIPAIVAALSGVSAPAMASDEPQQPPARPSVSLRPGPPPPTPSVNYPPASRIAESSSVPSDPASQLRDLRNRMEAMEKRVAELERKNPPAPTPASDKPEPARLRVQPR